MSSRPPSRFPPLKTAGVAPFGKFLRTFMFFLKTLSTACFEPVVLFPTPITSFVSFAALFFPPFWVVLEVTPSFYLVNSPDSDQSPFFPFYLQSQARCGPSLFWYVIHRGRQPLYGKSYEWFGWSPPPRPVFPSFLPIQLTPFLASFCYL